MSPRRGATWVSRLSLAAGLALTLQAGAATHVSAATASSTPCAAISAAEPQAGHTEPPAAPADFGPGFAAPNDCEWGYAVGGFGGTAPHAPLHRTPVIFVHGNQADAENWFLVADQMKREAGYTDQELYALSYNGLENGYAGLPTCCAPAPESTAYWQSTNPPGDAFCCNGGHGSANDVNVPDLYAFVREVQAYTGSEDVDIVAHSLGVTITRKMLLDHPELRPHVLAAVMIAGANHGTTVCRGLDTTYYGCDEIAPGTKWLEDLNTGLGEAPGPTRWMTVYNGNDNADPFFQAYPGVFDDRQSPHLDGAVNVTCPATYHNDLRVRPDIVQIYERFLLENGQRGGPVDVTLPQVAAPQFPCTVAMPPANLPETPVLPLLPLSAAVAVLGVRLRLGRRGGDDGGR